MTSYMPKQPRQTRERVEAKLEVSLVQKLQRYCEYLDSDRDYVIAQALEIAFKKDKGFDDWLQAQQTQAPTEQPGGPVPSADEIDRGQRRRKISNQERLPGLGQASERASNL